ncbi:hypothetical protein LC55x_0360 [Lysobacter capsici]|nr:hypothetical protein LC55x_0360 [Lysobacter capsici]
MNWVWKVMPSRKKPDRRIDAKSDCRSGVSRDRDIAVAS